MMIDSKAASPMRFATEPARQPKVVIGDVASRHLRFMLESITADKTLSEQERKRKIANFQAVLMAGAVKTKTLTSNDKKPETQTITSAESVTSATLVSSPLPKSKVDKKMEMELYKAALLASVAASVEKSKPPPPLKESDKPEATASTSIATTGGGVSISSGREALMDMVSPIQVDRKGRGQQRELPSPVAISLPQQPKLEAKKKTATVSKPKTQMATSTTSITSSAQRKPSGKPEIQRTMSAASVASSASISSHQPKSKAKKKKGWLVRKLTGKNNQDEVRGDFDEKGRGQQRELPSPVAISLPQQPKLEAKKKTATVSKPKTQMATSTTSITSSAQRKPSGKPEIQRTMSAASVASSASISSHQPKSKAKKKKGWLVRKLTGKNNQDEVRGDFDENDVTSGRSSRRDPAEVFSISEDGSTEVADESSMHDNQEETEDNANVGTGSDQMDAQSVDSDRSINTFEQDYINGMMRDQMEENNHEEPGDALSEGTFEQDARALSLDLSEGTFEQDAKALEREHHASAVFVPQEIGNEPNLHHPNLSETTFEQDAHQDYANDANIGPAESDLSDATFGSETTFERDVRKKAAPRTTDAPTTQIFEAPYLESVTTFEKEARGRAVVASKSRSFGPELIDDDDDDDDDNECSGDASSDCSDNFMRDNTAQNMRPAQPEPQPVWGTAAATYPMPKISELQLQLSPESISKKSARRSFVSKFTCHCG